MPLTRVDGHRYAELAVPVGILFNRSDLQKLHRQFIHSSTDKLYKLLKGETPTEIKADKGVHLRISLADAILIKKICTK